MMTRTVTTLLQRTTPRCVLEAGVEVACALALPTRECDAMQNRCECDATQPHHHKLLIPPVTTQCRAAWLTAFTVLHHLLVRSCWMFTGG